MYSFRFWPVNVSVTFISVPESSCFNKVKKEDCAAQNKPETAYTSPLPVWSATCTVLLPVAVQLFYVPPFLILPPLQLQRRNMLMQGENSYRMHAF